jgi:hypothetical protein
MKASEQESKFEFNLSNHPTHFHHSPMSAESAPKNVHAPATNPSLPPVSERMTEDVKSGKYSHPAEVCALQLVVALRKMFFRPPLFRTRATPSTHQVLDISS